MKSLIIIAIAIVSITAKAQINEIDEICNGYDEKIALAIAEEAPEMAPSMEIKSSLTKRAIGPVDHTILVYFDEEEVEYPVNGSDEPEFEMQGTARKIIFTIESASYLITETYYFNAKGNLIKYQERSEGYDCYLISIYMQGDKMLKYAQDPLKESSCDEQVESINTTEYNNSMEAKFFSKRNQSVELVDIFKKTYEQIKD